MERRFGEFVWDTDKEKDNIEKHGVDFTTAIKAFLDVKRRVYKDSKHSIQEERFFCVGTVGDRIITVRFTERNKQIRIFGAGYWRKGRIYYEKESD